MHIATPAAPGRALRVMTWNIKSLGGSFGGSADARVTAELAAAIREADPDIVVLQEVDRGTRRAGGRDQTAELAALVGASGSAFGAAMPRGGGEYGVAMLVRHGARLVAGTTRSHQLTKGSLPFAEPRVALESIVELADGARVRMITTHLSLGPQTRRTQLDELRVIAEHGPSVPTVLAGDLNSEPTLARHALTQRGGALRDAVLGAGLIDRDPSRITFPSLRQRPDHVFIAGAVDALAARSLLPGRALDARGLLPREQLSDHRALVVELQLR